jgi:hypothetical protein
MNPHGTRTTALIIATLGMAAVTAASWRIKPTSAGKFCQFFSLAVQLALFSLEEPTFSF